MKTYTEAQRKSQLPKSKAKKGVGINRPTSTNRENRARAQGRGMYHGKIR